MDLVELAHYLIVGAVWVSTGVLAVITYFVVTGGVPEDPDDVPTLVMVLLWPAIVVFALALAVIATAKWIGRQAVRLVKRRRTK